MIKKILLTLVVLIVIIIGGGYFYLTTKFPIDSPVEELFINSTPERFERGKYLVESVTGCFGCHSTRDYNKYSAPYVTNLKGGGGDNEFTIEKGLPGNLYAGNITPHALKNWTDGELFRAITTGISKDGRALFPVMPYQNYGKLDREDIYSIITYIRSIKSIKKEVPETEIDFPMNIITNTIPQHPEFKEIPNQIDDYNYGKYLVTAASCNDCHTQKNKGKELEGMKFAGGFKLTLDDGSTVYSSNITPDKETGIGEWTKEKFINTFKAFEVPLKDLNDVQSGGQNTLMPWFEYSGMSNDDLGAIYDYLMQQEPVNHKVDEWKN